MTGLIARTTFEDVATFVVAIAILIGGFYGLLRDGNGADIRVIYGGLITMVGTFYFQQHATKAATKNTIDAQNNGLDAIRQTVTRIEDGRTPSAQDLLQRDAKHP